MNIPVLFEDDSLIAFDKPIGLVVNTSKSSGDFTLQTYLISNYNQPYSESPETETEEDAEFDEFKSRSGIVHRLDKQTSGIVLVAKTDESFRNLQKQFKSRTVSKKYTAVTVGKFPDEKAEIDAPIMRNPDYRYKMAMSEDGKEALTEIVREKFINKAGLDFTLVTAFPKTGRTHQIRVHLAGTGYPVAGDDIYMTKKQYEQIIPIFNRMMLHATEITLSHPITGEELKITSPLPQEFQL